MTYTAPVPATVAEVAAPAAPAAPAVPAAPAAPVSNASPLTGDELLFRFNALRAEGIRHADIAVECGYYIKVAEGPRAGEVRASTAKLNQAILQAQGLVAAGKGKGGSGSGIDRKVIVSKHGRAALSAAAVALLGAQPGDYLKTTKVEEGLLVTVARKQTELPV
jgi:hypothetical protein